MGLFIIALLAKKRGWYVACIVVNVISVMLQLCAFFSNPYYEFNPTGLFFIIIYITVCLIKISNLNDKEDN